MRISLKNFLALINNVNAITLNSKTTTIANFDTQGTDTAISKCTEYATTHNLNNRQVAWINNTTVNTTVRLIIVIL